MFISLPTLEADIDILIAAERYNDALANIVVGVHNNHKLPEAAHKFLYYPQFDRQMQQLSDVLVRTGAPASAQPVGENTLIIATEMYPVGGHSRVVADVARESPSPTVVLTDMFSSYRKTPDHLNWLLETLEYASVIVLPQPSLWAKCRALSLLTQRLQPRSILYFNHHQDPIPFVGTLGHAASRKTLVHHCDHNPSLGNTLAGIGHADFTDELAHTCAKHLHRETSVLPLYVSDAGKKSFEPIEGNAFSVVTSGTHIKFARSGELALQRIAHTVLTHVRGQFFHIGPIDGEWVAEIKSHLESNDIDPTRFNALGSVPSLWTSLAQLDAHLYLGSAPVGGGRAAIEAQGCGYPVAFFRGSDPDSALAVDSVYASKELGWGNLAELSTLLKSLGPQQATLSADARALYEQCYSRDEFVRVLKELNGA